MKQSNTIGFEKILRYLPMAVALIKGSEQYPQIEGTVKFFATELGTLVSAEITGLPEQQRGFGYPVFGFHIHGGESCTGTAADPFANAQMHYNPDGLPHPYHRGDMPPLFGADGIAFSAFLTDRFTVDEVVGKTVIIHDMPDDFTTQPSGNSGSKIACGNIVLVRR